MRNGGMRTWIVLLFVIITGMAALRAQDHAGQYSQADIAYGAQLYGTKCSSCHGVEGNAVTGVDLGSGQFRHAKSDADLMRVIGQGIEGTAMPRGAYSEPELAGLVAYIRSMRGTTPADLAGGDPARGRRYFEGEGKCLQCHGVRGRGGRIGPDLSDIGTVRTAGALHRTLLDPGGSLLPFNRSVRAVTESGQTIQGLRLNEDTSAVQLMTEEGLVSLEKARLREYVVLQESGMPSYRDTNPATVADLVSYLLSLRHP